MFVVAGEKSHRRDVMFTAGLLDIWNECGIRCGGIRHVRGHHRRAFSLFSRLCGLLTKTTLAEDYPTGY